MRLILCVALLSVPLAGTRAQSADSTAIVALVDKLFHGMQTRDTAAMRSAFGPEARMLRLTPQGGVQFPPIDTWVNSVARSPEGTVLRERTWAHQVHVDGNIAQAWMQYDLYVGERFSHCGVDAFDLVKLGGEWKIIAVMDTRRTTGCTEPPPHRR